MRRYLLTRNTFKLNLIKSQFLNLTCCAGYETALRRALEIVSEEEDEANLLSEAN